MTSPFLHVRSPDFRIMRSEADELVNEGTYGKSCAIYLRDKLTTRGYNVPSFCAEDWGWWINVAGMDFPCGIGVYGQQIADTDQLDVCVTVLTPKRKRWNWKKFCRFDTTEEIERLHEAIREIFATDPNVTVVSETEDFPLN